MSKVHLRHRGYPNPKRPGRDHPHCGRRGLDVVHIVALEQFVWVPVRYQCQHCQLEASRLTKGLFTSASHEQELIVESIVLAVHRIGQDQHEHRCYFDGERRVCTHRIGLDPDSERRCGGWNWLDPTAWQWAVVFAAMQASKPVDPRADLVVTVGCEAVHPDRRGGQHVAKPCTGVRIRHAPTGLEVVATDERSQHANRAAAARELLYRMAMRQPDGVSVHEDVRAQLSAWAEERRP